MHIVCVAGTRPNLVKLAPVLAELERQAIRTTFVDAAQHYDPALSSDLRADLGLRDPDVGLATGSGTHAEQTARVMTAFEPVLADLQPDATVVFGDVNTTLGCALVAAKVPVLVAHVEAGLRSGDPTMPEEVNRRAVDAVSHLLLAPSEEAVANLRAEGAPDAAVRLVGNTMVDSLRRGLPAARATDVRGRLALPEAYGVVTLHRPANVDDPARLGPLLRGLGELAADLPLVLPAHPRLQARLGEQVPPGITVVGALGYLDFLALEDGASVVLTDSGGVQEETSALGVPCVTMRTTTERPVTILQGTNVLAGVQPDAIVAAAREALAGGRREPAAIVGWDGAAAPRIVHALVEALADGAVREPEHPLLRSPRPEGRRGAAGRPSSSAPEAS